MFSVFFFFDCINGVSTIIQKPRKSYDLSTDQIKTVIVSMLPVITLGTLHGIRQAVDDLHQLLHEVSAYVLPGRIFQTANQTARSNCDLKK